MWKSCNPTVFGMHVYYDVRNYIHKHYIVTVWSLSLLWSFLLLLLYTVYYCYYFFASLNLFDLIVVSILLWEWAIRVRTTGDVWASFCKGAYVVWRGLCAIGRLCKNVIVPHGKQGPLVFFVPSLAPSLPPSLFLSRFLCPSFFACLFFPTGTSANVVRLVNTHTHSHIFHTNWRITAAFHIVCSAFIIEWFDLVHLRRRTIRIARTSPDIVRGHGGAVGPCGTPVASANKSPLYENVDFPNLTRELTM